MATSARGYGKASELNPQTLPLSVVQSLLRLLTSRLELARLPFDLCRPSKRQPRSASAHSVLRRRRTASFLIWRSSKSVDSLAVLRSCCST